MLNRLGGIFRSGRKSLSFITLIAVAVLTGTAASNALLLDTETSTDNLFAAAGFDLQIDNTCSYNGKICSFDAGLQKYIWSGTEEECYCTWDMRDLTDEVFFNFPNVVPGNYGEDSVSIHVADSDAWICAEISNFEVYDNGCTTAESADADVSCGDPGIGEGELQNELKFSLWKDTNCNSVKDAEEVLLRENLAFSEFRYAVADSTTVGAPVIAGQTYCLGISWIVDPDANNIIQTDSIVGDISFTAVQADGAGDYVCFEETVSECTSDADCEDANVCTTNTCSAENTCVSVNNSVSCNDGIFCNGSDICGGGTCSIHSGDPCPGADGDISCSESCNETADNCTAYDPDGSACSEGECLDGACVPAVTNETDCSDGIDDDTDGKVDCADTDCSAAPLCVGDVVWINEIHYDNDGGDESEGVEVAGVAGTDLTGWKIESYNGDGSMNGSISLSGVLPNEENGYGTLWFSFTGLQNDIEAVALVDSHKNVIQFLGYEGSFSATSGSAIGLVSVNIGVFETEATTPVDYSLQLINAGNGYSDFSWSGPIVNTRGMKNTGQTFTP